MLCYFFAEREYRCLGQWKEDDLIYTYTERRDLIGYECFVGLITKKGDIFLKEAGNNCERGQEPLKYGMRLTQVSKCYSNPRLAWTTTHQPRRHKPKATALPRWRERELNNFIDSGAPKLVVQFPTLLLIISSWLTYCFCMWNNLLLAIFPFAKISIYQGYFLALHQVCKNGNHGIKITFFYKP